MVSQIPLREADRAAEREAADGTREIAPDLAYKRLAMVNVALYGRPGAGDRNWVLIDAGIAGAKGTIVQAAAQRFGEGARPVAIVLTHGHFDHVGVLEDLAAEWDTPVWAHALEHPYLDGRASYPPPDPWVGGGLMPLLSPLFPRSPVDVGTRLRALPEDGAVPGMPGWRWLHTPGHAPGHVSLWREADRLLVAGDAFVTTGQESAYEVALQTAEMHGPPRYFTPDWEKAKSSVRRLAALEPETAVTGHGLAMQGAGMREALQSLARDFDAIAVPEGGRYVDRPARAEDGSAYR